eukprot:421098-Amphidinium_carterae.1
MQCWRECRGGLVCGWVVFFEQLFKVDNFEALVARSTIMDRPQMCVLHWKYVVVPLTLWLSIDAAGGCVPGFLLWTLAICFGAGVAAADAA